jgi:CBS domain-containing protein
LDEERDAIQPPRVVDVAKEPPAVLDEETTIADAAKRMAEVDAPSLPVRDGDGGIMGLLTRRDIVVDVVAAGKVPAESRAGRHANAVMIGSEAPLDEALELMRRHRVDSLPVERDGRLAGVVTRVDAEERLRRRRSVERLREVFRGKAVADDVLEDISAHDAMFGGNREDYFWIGQAALHCIALAMALTGRETFSKILDLPSGHGRVLRALKAYFPEASLTACDIDRDGVDFCAQKLGATPVYSSEDPGEVELPGTYDLIWCGSLLTHLDAERGERFLRLFESVLEPDGLLLVTMHGEPIATRLRTGEETLELGGGAVARLLAQYDEQGFGYVDYPNQERYGISLASPDWMTRKLSEAGLEPVGFAAAHWLTHDVYTSCAGPG